MSEIMKGVLYVLALSQFLGWLFVASRYWDRWNSMWPEQWTWAWLLVYILIAPYILLSIILDFLGTIGQIVWEYLDVPIVRRK